MIGCELRIASQQFVGESRRGSQISAFRRGAIEAELVLFDVQSVRYQFLRLSKNLSRCTLHFSNID